MPKTTSENQNSSNYHSILGCVDQFFMPHSQANHLNAQDVVHALVNQSLSVSIAAWNCFEDGAEIVVKDEIVANLILDIQTKLELIEKVLPLAFNSLTVEEIQKRGAIND